MARRGEDDCTRRLTFSGLWVIGVAADGFDGLQSDGAFDIIVPFAVMRLASGDPTGPVGPFRSKDVVGRLAHGVSIEEARAEPLARWPSIQAATLPATLSENEREALLRQRLDVAPLASGFSGLRSRYGTTLIGAPCAWAAARLVRAQLYGIAPSDPRTLLIAAAIFLATALAASLFPALRASRVAPVEALREE